MIIKNSTGGFCKKFQPKNYCLLIRDYEGYQLNYNNFIEDRNGPHASENSVQGTI